MPPEELPVGVVTADLGAPAFLALMAHRGVRFGSITVVKMVLSMAVLAFDGRPLVRPPQPRFACSPG